MRKEKTGERFKSEYKKRIKRETVLKGNEMGEGQSRNPLEESERN